MEDSYKFILGMTDSLDLYQWLLGPEVLCWTPAPPQHPQLKERFPDMVKTEVSALARSELRASLLTSHVATFLG